MNKRERLSMKVLRFVIYSQPSITRKEKEKERNDGFSYIQGILRIPSTYRIEEYSKTRCSFFSLFFLLLYIHFLTMDQLQWERNPSVTFPQPIEYCLDLKIILYYTFYELSNRVYRRNRA